MGIVIRQPASYRCAAAAITIPRHARTAVRASKYFIYYHLTRHGHYLALTYRISSLLAESEWAQSSSRHVALSSTEITVRPWLSQPGTNHVNDFTCTSAPLTTIRWVQPQHIDTTNQMTRRMTQFLITRPLMLMLLIVAELIVAELLPEANVNTTEKALMAAVLAQ